jgi:hypothetical protein
MTAAFLGGDGDVYREPAYAHVADDLPRVESWDY